MPAAEKEKHDPKESKTEICKQKQIKEAVHALKLLNKKFVEEDMKKQPLLEDTSETPVYLQVMLKKIPPSQLMQMIRVPLPHSLINETSEVCLITGDLEKRNHKAEIEPTVLHYKDLLEKNNVTKVAQVIPLRQLRTEYKTFESRRQLAAAYDVFLADKKIAGVLPKTLGKSFFKDRKFPIQIDMRRQNLKNQIDKALCQTEFSLTCRGNTYTLEIARLSMEDDAIMENIKTTIEVLENKLPGKDKNILSLYLKTAKSKAIPIYLSLDISDDILIKKPRKNEKYKLDELSTMDDAEVKVFRDGRVVLRKMKKESNSYENAPEDDKDVGSNEPVLDDLIEDENSQETSQEVSLKKKKGKKASDSIKISNDAHLKNKEDFQDYAANKSSTKKKRKNKKAAELEVANNVELENREDFQDSVADKNFRKNKKGRKNSLEQVAVISEVKNDIENFIVTEISPLKKKGKKDMIDHVLDNKEINIEDIQNSSCKALSKKKNKKNINSSPLQLNEALEDVRETSILLSSKKRKLHEDISETANKSKNKKISKSEEIEKNTKTYKDILEIDISEEDVNLETTPKSKKEKRKSRDAAKAKSSISIEEMPINEKTPLRSKKMKRESINVISNEVLVSSRKKATMNNDINIISEPNNRRKSDRIGNNLPLKAKNKC